MFLPAEGMALALPIDRPLRDPFSSSVVSTEWLKIDETVVRQAYQLTQLYGGRLICSRQQCERHPRQEEGERLCEQGDRCHCGQERSLMSAPADVSPMPVGSVVTAPIVDGEA